MTTASERGRKNRGKGSRWEVAVAKFLRESTGLDVATTRDLSGGRRSGADLGTVLKRDHTGKPIAAVTDVAGWTLECKDDESSSVASMLRQAKNDADGGLYAVIHKRRNHPTHTAHVYLPLHALVWWTAAHTLDEDHPERDRTVTIDLDTYAHLLVLDIGEVAA